MNNRIFQKSFQVLAICMLIIAVYYFLRGHNEPGGGFIGGLILALALILKDASRPVPQIPSFSFFVTLLGSFCSLLVLTILFPIFFGEAMLTGLWTKIPIPIAGKFSSILVFDLGIFLIVGYSNLYLFRILSNTKRGTIS